MPEVLNRAYRLALPGFRLIGNDDEKRNVQFMHTYYLIEITWKYDDEFTCP